MVLLLHNHKKCVWKCLSGQKYTKYKRVKGKNPMLMRHLQLSLLFDVEKLVDIMKKPKNPL